MMRSSHCVLAMSGFVWLTGCAQSAIDDVLEGFDAAVVGIAGDAQVDASGDLDAGLGRDAGSIPVAQPDSAFVDDEPDADDEDASEPEDASEEDDASEPNGADAGRADAGVDAGRDAGPEAGAPEASVPDAGPSCPSGQTLCGSACVDTATESAHCGQCNRACTSTQVCTASACVAVTPTPNGCTAASYESHNYYICTGKEDDWVDARRACLGLGMDLAVPNTSPENDFLTARNGSKKLWVGVSDRDKEGEERLVQFGTENNTAGTIAGYFKWSSGEPNNTQNCVLGFICTGGDEDCIELNVDGTWNDAKCSNTHPYACESY